jgi:hypothetical protein
MYIGSWECGGYRETELVYRCDRRVCIYILLPLLLYYYYLLAANAILSTYNTTPQTLSLSHILAFPRLSNGRTSTNTPAATNNAPLT